MGSSAKKKREKRNDFQKPKLKVGKAKPKAANHTDTSFQSKAIILSRQSLSVSAPSTDSLFAHHISLLTAKPDSQRRESLGYLTTFITSRPIQGSLPQPLSTLLPKLFPLILDGSNAVRVQLMKLFRSLPKDVESYVSDALPYVRAGMTHLAADVRSFAVDVLSWMLQIAAHNVVSCAGGWYKTLNCFLSILGWHTQDSVKWISNRANYGRSANEGRPLARNLQVLTEFVQAGLGQEAADTNAAGAGVLPQFPGVGLHQHALARKSYAFRYLYLFGEPKVEEAQALEDREDRLKVFNDVFRSAIETGAQSARKEGGEVGRAAAALTKLLKDTAREVFGG